MKMNTACQLNYVISVAYGNVEYNKYLENVENKWYNTVKVFVYGVTDMNKEKYLVLIDGKDKTEEIEKLEQTEKYYIMRIGDFITVRSEDGEVSIFRRFDSRTVTEIGNLKASTGKLAMEVIIHN